MISPRDLGRRGFGVGAILYMLGLIGIAGGIFFSNYMQSFKAMAQIQNGLTVRNDLMADTMALAIQSVFSSNNAVLCPPRSTHQSTGQPCVNAPVGLIQFEDFSATQRLPANFVNASSTGTPEEVGVFAVGMAKQIDAYGHAYIVCRWEQSRTNPSAPAFVVISAGPDGILQTSCGDTVAQGDDYMQAFPVAQAISHASLWEPNGTDNVAYGALGSQVVVDGEGNITAAGNITGNAGSFATLSVSGASQLSGSTTIGGLLTAQGASLGATTLTSLTDTGAVTVTGTSTLGVLNAQASTLDSLSVTNSAVMNSGLSVQGGNLVLGNGYSYSENDSGGTARSLVALDGQNDVVIGGHNGTQSIYLLTGSTASGVIDTSGDLTMSGNVSGVNGTFSNAISAGSASITGLLNSNALTTGTLSASNTTISGTLNVSSSITGSTANFSGNVTAANFIGMMSVGSGGVTINGVIPIANGGTGASTASGALNNLGVTSGGVFNTGLLTAGLINGSYLTSNSVTSTQLSATGVASGLCYSPTVGADGRITACGSTAPASAAGSTGDIQFDNGTSLAASNNLYWDNINNRLGIGTTAPDVQLEIYGALPAVDLASTQNAQKEYQFVNDGNYAYIKDLTDALGEFRVRSNTNLDVARFSYGAPANSFYLTSSGSIGIGTSSPSSTLTINGTLSAGTSALAATTVSSFVDNGAATILGATNQIGAFTATGSVTINNGETVSGTAVFNSNVGIGSTSPGALLDVYNASASSLNLHDSLSGFKFVTFNGSNYIESAGAGLTGAATLNFSNGGASHTWMTIGTTGSVGIGTVSPQATLDINGYSRLLPYSAAPASCVSANQGSLALTAKYTLCVCNGSSWATATDGSTICAWTNTSTPIQIILTSTGANTWTVPSNWNSSNNKIEVVGAGAGGAAFNFTSAGSVGGGGGAYSNLTNLTLTPGATVNYTIGLAGNGETGSAAAQNGGDTWFNATAYASSSVAAKGGNAVSSGNTGGLGGAASSGIGSTKTSGGNGGNSGTNNAGAGGGGAGGPDGNGVNGTAGASGSSSAGSVGGAGDNGNQGTGGTGGAFSSKNGGTGGSGTDSGGGGGGGYSSDGNGGAGGNYGAGGGGGGSADDSTIGGQGANGAIVITYTP